MIKWAVVTVWISINSYPLKKSSCVVTRTEPACHIVRGMEKSRLGGGLGNGYIYRYITECQPLKDVAPLLIRGCQKGDF